MRPDSAAPRSGGDAHSVRRRARRCLSRRAASQKQLTKPLWLCISCHMSEMIYSVGDLARGTGVLGGASAGRQHLDTMLAALAAEPEAPGVVLLDFTNVEVATASWIREAVLGLRDRLRERRSNWYPAVCNLSEDVKEDFLILLRQRGDVVLAMDPAGDGGGKGGAYLGVLDEKQKMTFRLVNERRETDAGALMKDYGEREGTRHQTAWNNRLAGLAEKGLVAELSRGRAKRYRALLAPAGEKG